MESRAINDLSNKWIEEEINAAYFKRIKDSLKNGASVKEASDAVGAFLQYGCDISEKDIEKLSAYYKMNDAEKKTALIARLKDEIKRAKKMIAENDSHVLKTLVSYVDDSYDDEIKNEKKGIDAMSCEYLIGKIRYASENIESISEDFLESGVL